MNRDGEKLVGVQRQELMGRPRHLPHSALGVVRAVPLLELSQIADGADCSQPVTYPGGVRNGVCQADRQAGQRDCVMNDTGAEHHYAAVRGDANRVNETRAVVQRRVEIDSDATGRQIGVGHSIGVDLFPEQVVGRGIVAEEVHLLVGLAPDVLGRKVIPIAARDARSRGVEGVMGPPGAGGVRREDVPPCRRQSKRSAGQVREGRFSEVCTDEVNLPDKAAGIGNVKVMVIL